MSLSAWLSVVAICALGAVSPGPSLLVVLSNALHGGVVRGLATALAHAAGVGLYALATAAGLAVLIADRPALRDALAVAGALYLIWLARAAITRGPPAAADRSRVQGLAWPAAQGLAVALVNPKIAVFFLAVFAQFVGPEAGLAQHLLLAGTATAVDGIWYALVALAAARGARLARLREHGALLQWVTAGALLALAGFTLVGVWR